MERAGITLELILMEHIKFDDSETLKKKKEEEGRKFGKIKYVIEAKWK